MSCTQFAQAVTKLIVDGAEQHPALAPLSKHIFHLQPPLNAPMPFIVITEDEASSSTYFTATDDVSLRLTISIWLRASEMTDWISTFDNGLTQLLNHSKLGVKGFTNVNMHLFRHEKPRIQDSALNMTSHWQIVATGVGGSI